MQERVETCGEEGDVTGMQPADTCTTLTLSSTQQHKLKSPIFRLVSEGVGDLLQDRAGKSVC